MTSSTIISCLLCHSPSYNEVTAFTDSSKTSFLFFYNRCLTHGIGDRHPVTAYLAKGRSRDPPISFPLVKFRRQDIIPQKPEDFVGAHRLRKSLARTEYRLSANQVSRDRFLRTIIVTSADLNRVGIGRDKTPLGSRPQSNLSTRVGRDFYTWGQDEGS